MSGHLPAHSRARLCLTLLVYNGVIIHGLGVVSRFLCIVTTLRIVRNLLVKCICVAHRPCWDVSVGVVQSHNVGARDTAGYCELDVVLVRTLVAVAVWC